MLPPLWRKNIMGRSNLTTRFHAGVIGKFEKQFIKNYKEENGESFKGNVLSYITLGVIQRKRIPDINDCLLLIKLGNGKDCTDEYAEEKLSAWLENEDNRDRGLTGAFCDLCKDMCLDLPINKPFRDQVNGLEELINGTQETMSKLSDMIMNLKNIVDKNKENLAVDNKDTQE
jgi:hypothetical protein